VRCPLENPLSSSPASRAGGGHQETRTLARRGTDVSELPGVLPLSTRRVVQECEPASLSRFASRSRALRTDSPMALRGSHGNLLHFSLPSASFESLLLPPRSAPQEGPGRLTPHPSVPPTRLPTQRPNHGKEPLVGVRSLASAPSIFRATSFGR
jgi:hypothetical protein